MSIIAVDGRTVEYHQRGQGADLLLLHSLLTDASVFDAMLPVLARTHRVTCINLPGFGRSSPTRLVTVADYAHNVVQTMDALALPSTTHLFGNGFGAFIALMLVIRHGRRVGKLLVADVVSAFPESARAPFQTMASSVMQSGMRGVLDAAIDRMLPPEYQQRFPEIVAARKAQLASVDPACFAQACLALANLDMRSSLGAVRNRTLVMCGALDLTTPPALAKEVAGAISNATYREIVGSGHCPMLERSEELLSLMTDFLKESERPI